MTESVGERRREQERGDKDHGKRGGDRRERAPIQTEA